MLLSLFVSGEVWAVSLSGTVFQDSTNNGVVDGTGIGDVNGNQLYIHIVDDDSNMLVVDAISVATNGTWSVDVPDGVDYDVFLSTILLLTGDDNNTNVGLPQGWGLVGDFDPDGGGTFDESPDGNIDLSTNTGTVTNINFGINVATDFDVSCPAGYATISQKWEHFSIQDPNALTWPEADGSYTRSFSIPYTDLLGNAQTFNMDIEFTDLDNLNSDTMDPNDAFYVNPFGDTGCGGSGAFVDPWDSDCVFSTPTSTIGNGRLEMVMKSLNSDQGITFTYKFTSKPAIVAGISFSDIDASNLPLTNNPLDTEQPGNSWQDKIEVSGVVSDGGGVATFNIMPGVPSNFVVTGTGAYAEYLTQDIDPDALSGILVVSSNEMLNEFSFTYSNGPTDAQVEADNPNLYTWWTNPDGIANSGDERPPLSGVSDDSRSGVKGITLCVLSDNNLEPVPTLSGWMLLILTLMLLIFAQWKINLRANKTVA